MKIIKRLIRKIKIFLYKYLYLIPIIMLIACGLSVFLTDEFLRNNDAVIGNSLGCSILSNIPLLCYFTFRNQYCFITRASPVGLIVVNILDILSAYLESHVYTFWYTVTTVFIVLLLTIFFKITKLNK